MSPTAAAAERSTDRTVRLGGYRIRILGEVRKSHLAVFERRVTIGDSSRDSDEFLSSWISGDYSGGLGVEDMNEGTDTSRFRFGIAETRFLNHITLPLQATTTRPAAVASAAVARPLGDVGNEFYVAFDAVPYAWRESDDQWYAAAATLTNIPVNKGVQWKGSLWVPQGANGYKKLDSSGAGTLTVTAGAAGITPVAFRVWARKLFALEHNGGISYTVNGTTWIAPENAEDGLPLEIDSSRKPRHLVSFYNRLGESMLYIITDQDVWSYAHATSTLEVAMEFPPLRENGLGAGVWRAGEDLWISQGIGFSRLTSAAVIVPTAGLDRDDGLPANYRGKIVDVQPEYNGLYALVQGDAASVSSETWSEDAGTGDDPTVVPSGAAYAAMFCWTGTGWHCVWGSDDASKAPSWAMVSAQEAVGGYRLWWGMGPDVLTMPLRRTFHSPKQGFTAGIDAFAATGYVESPRFDAAMRGFQKIARKMVLYADSATATETITVRYRTDADADTGDFPHTLGQITAPGKTELLFDPDGDTFPEGQEFGWFQYRLDFTRGIDITKTPILDAVVLNFMKVPQDAVSFVFTVPLNNARGLDRTPGETDALLEEMLVGNRLYEFVHQDQRWVAKVASLAGADATGGDESGQRTVTLIAFPLEEAA